MKQVLTHRMHCCAVVTENESNRGNKRERENNSKKQGAGLEGDRAPTDRQHREETALKSEMC